MKLVNTAGDMAIKDLTPKSTNIGDRIVKNMRICGSGIYTYARREAHLLHLDPVPEKFQNLELINVYRPPEVLEKYKDYFARVPIITGHHVRVDRNNAKELTVGMVGDTVESEIDKDDGETYLYTTGTIVAGDGVDAYEQYGQLSVGYDPIMEWEEGVHNGVPYQAVLKGFNDVNHLLICKVARGGPQCMVMDSLDDLSPLERFITQNQNGGEDMGIFTKIFGSVRKTKMAGDAQVVSVLLQSIKAGADPKIQVQKVRDIVGDSNTEFAGFLDELSQVDLKKEQPEVVSKAIDIVDEYYRTKMMGDEACPKCGKTPCECDKAGDEKSKGQDDATADVPDAKPAGDETADKKDDKPADDKSAGDQKSCGDAFDMDVFADKVADLVIAKQAAAAKTPDNNQTAGDEGSEFDTPLNGDSKSEAHGSDDFMKDIWG